MWPVKEERVEPWFDAYIRASALFGWLNCVVLCFSKRRKCAIRSHKYSRKELEIAV